MPYQTSGAAAGISGYALTKYCRWAFSLHPHGNEDQDALLLATNKGMNDYINKLFTFGQPLLFFIFGALIGALVMHYASFWCLFIPIGCIAFILFDTAIHHYPGTPPVSSSSSL